MQTPKSKTAPAQKTRKIKITKRDRDLMARICRRVGHDLQDLAKIVDRCGGNHPLPAGHARDLVALKGLVDSEEMASGALYLSISQLLGGIAKHGEEKRDPAKWLKDGKK